MRTRIGITLSCFLSLTVLACAPTEESEPLTESSPNEPETERATPPEAFGATVTVDEPRRVPADRPSLAAGPDSGAPDADAPDPPVADDDPGPPPTKTCTVSKDQDGFFVRSSPKSDYVAYVPASYDGSPMPLVVGLHGCGDNAHNFATWGVNPWATRATQEYIGISVDGASGGRNCWSMGGDDDKVLAAVDDIASCFYVDRKKVVVAGFSSGGQLAYRVGLEHAERFAGVLIECSSLYAAGDDPDALLAGAAWKLPIAHRAHTGDTVFPIDAVRGDWAKIKAAGFPLTTSEVSGGHDGSGDDWAGWLLPIAAGWEAP